MKIVTNITREHIGGITRSNISFLDFLHKTEDRVVGVELMAKRCIKGATIFNHLAHDWFEHYIINLPDISLTKVIKYAKNISIVEKRYREIIDLIKDILIKEKPDVVFLNGTYYIPWLISIAAYELKIPVVLRYAGVYSKETERLKPKFKKFFNNIEKSFYKRVNFLIFPSLLCKKVVEEEILHKKIFKYSIIPNPFNLPKIKHVIKNSKDRIAAVGRWDGIKNFRKFFEIHKDLKKENWKHEASFVTNDCKIKKFPKTIRRISPMEHEEILKFYSSQGLIICPSVFETFGNVPVEAVCMGTPVLVSDNMGCAEVFKQVGLDNMVISFSDRELVLERIKQLCGYKISPKNINDLKKILNPREINLQIMSILKEVIKNR
jgi:glycosyltransferase involved in cell wall biosynthesis